VGVALVIEVAGMNPDDRAADVTGFRVPPNPISHLELLRHVRFLTAVIDHFQV